VYHAQLQNRQHVLGLIPLMQLCDFAILGRHHGGAVDWAWLYANARHYGIGRALQSYVHLAVELLGFSRPSDIPEVFRDNVHLRRCVAQLRRPAVLSLVRQWGALTDVFTALYLDTYYGHSTNPLTINFFRWRMLYDLFRRYRWQIAGRMSELWRFGSPGQPR
jgi:hypothetical protein